MGELANNETNLVNGFKVGNDGKLRAGGKVVSKEIEEAARKGEIVFGLDLAALKQQRQKAATQVDLVKGLDAISPNIGKLKIGMAAKLPVPKTNDDGKNPKRAFVMGVVSKLNNITAKGREWAGRTFSSQLTPDGEFLYVVRGEDTEHPHERKITKGGGRPRKDTGLKDALAAARKHLGGDSSEEGGEKAQEEAQALTDAVVDGGEPVNIGEEGAIEEAVVIKH